MLELSNVPLPLDAGLSGARGERALREAVACAAGVSEGAIEEVRLLKRSVDARKKSNVRFVATVAISLKGEEAGISGDILGGALDPISGSPRIAALHLAPGVNAKIHEPLPPLSIPRCEPAEDGPRPVVVGTGPAGLFAALYLAEAGLRPLVLERGAAVNERMEAVEVFSAGGALNPQVNIQFGEGGAGTFSDGKLNTGTKSPHIRHVLRAFVDAGAPEEILWQAKPHIGTDKLVDVVRNLRKRIVAAGGEVRFRAQLTGLRFAVAAEPATCRDEVASLAAGRAACEAEDAGAAAERVASAVEEVACTARPQSFALESIEITDTRTGAVESMSADTVILACGHSARDTFEMLYEQGVSMERKPFAVGVRIEHPQQLINRVQYGKAADHPALGAADYKLAVHLPDGRGVYTFCMCPGGEVVAAASEEGGVCVNGMSRFARDGENANSALLVEVRPDDLPGNEVLAGVAFQREVERAAFAAGGGAYRAPAQTVGDFLRAACPNGYGQNGAWDGAQNPNGDRGPVQVGPDQDGVVREDDVLKGCACGGEARFVRPTYPRGVTWCDLSDCLPPFVAGSLAQALPLLDRKLRGFAHPDAVMTAVEARSSSPVRIVRGAGMQSVSHAGLYPCGEGAGYAGGITSAAVDGLRVAEAIVASRASGLSFEKPAPLQ